MAVFPTTVPLRVPAARTLTIPTDVVEFLDGSEQRWRSGPPLNAFSLTFTDVPSANLTDMRTFLNTMKGAYDSTWSITWVDGNSYTNMALELDDLPAVASKSNTRFSFTVKMRQTAPQTYTATASAVYPALPNGIYTQRPYTLNTRFLTTRNDLPSGPRYSYYEWPSGHGAFLASYPTITLTELLNRLNFFVAMGGRYTMFSFTDPVTSAVHPHCRFDTDDFACQCLGAGIWSVSLPIVEFFA